MIFRGGSRTSATSKIERFVIIVNGWKLLTIITKRSILNVAEVLDSPQILCHCFSFFIRILLHHTKSKRQPLEVLHKNEIFKKFAKYAQRNPSAGVFINKVIGWRPSNLLKRNCNTDVFL